LWVLVQFYNDRNPLRNVENEFAVKTNLDNPAIHNMIVMMETKTVLPQWIIENPKVITASTGERRLTFKDALKFAETVMHHKDILVIVNTDIFLDHKTTKWSDLFQIFESNPSKIVMALTRHEYASEDAYWMDQAIEQGYSQDAWIFQKYADVPLVSTKLLDQLDFCVGGCPGCDNYLVYLLKKFGGVDMYNLAFQFKIFHFDRCRGHTLGSMIFTEKTDFTVRKLMESNQDILTVGVLCPYIDYQTISIPLLVNDVSSQCFRKTHGPHKHTTNVDTNNTSGVNGNIVFDELRYIELMKMRITAVHCTHVTPDERTKTLSTCVKSMTNTQTYLNVLEIIKNYDFPDAAYMYCCWTMHLYQKQKLREAMNKAMVACKFHYNSECDPKLVEYYTYTRYHLVGYIGYAVGDYVNGLSGAQKAYAAKPNETDKKNIALYETALVTCAPSHLMDKVIASTTFWFCVPLYNRCDDITKLLNNLLDTCTTFSIKIVIADFTSTDINFEHVKYPIVVINVPGVFNIAKALQTCTDYCHAHGLANDILVLLDADTVFNELQKTLTYISNVVVRGKSYYCPIVSTEAKPNVWSATFNGEVYVPNEEHFGTGFIAIHNGDYEMAGGFKDSVFLTERGESWGYHDTYLTQKLGFLRQIRPVESEVWLRSHKRDANTKWFSAKGANYF